MRIFVSWTDLTGSRRSTRVNLANCSNTTAVLKLICKELSVNRQSVIVRLKVDPLNLVVIDNWPISHYPIINGSCFVVQVIEQSSSPSLGESLEQIEEQDFLEDVPSRSNDSPDKAEPSSLELKYAHYLEHSLNSLLDKVREGNLAEISLVLKQEPVVEDEETLNQLLVLKSRYLANEMGDCGRNALHWAIHMKHPEVVAFLLIKGADPRTVTLDGYTPLQLAVLHHSPQIVSLLLEQPRLDPNQLTTHGTALHLAVTNQNISCIQLLLQNEASLEVSDLEGKTPLDVCQSSKIKAMLVRKREMGKLATPNIVKGPVFRVSSTTCRLKERLLLVNPFKGNLTLSSLEGELQDKIDLKDVADVEQVEEKSWLMKSSLHYWKVLGRGQQKPLLLAVNHSQICDKWISHFRTSLKYVEYSQYTKAIPAADQVIEFLDDHKGEIVFHRRKVEQKAKIGKSIMALKAEQSQEPLSPKKLSLKETTGETSSAKSTEEDKYRESEILMGSVIQEKRLTPSVTSSFESSSTFEQQKSSNRFRKHSENRVEQVSEFNTESIGSISYSDFEVTRLLGTGAFGKVYLARYRSTGVWVALKVLNKKKLFAKKQLKYAVGETNILKKVDSPFIVKLFCAFQTPSNLYLALDHCPHGDLAELIATRDHLKESTARFVIAQLILAIEYLHKEGILYRDLKPENILIGRDGYIRLTDFGLSRENSFAGSFCGSPAYLSPEMLEKKGVGASSDIYGIGCVLYQMVVGQPPYFNEDITQLFQNIKEGRLRFPSALSQDIRSLLSQLLERDIKRRLGTKNMNEIKRHCFFSKLDWSRLETKKLPVPRQVLEREEEEEDELELQVNKPIALVDHDYNESTRMINRIKNFTFVREGSLKAEPEQPILQRGAST